MIKPNELMKGDLVYNTHNRQPEQVYEIREHKVLLAYNDLYDFDEIEPIPLTPEFLLKNGFFLMNEEDKAYRWEYADGVFINADFKADEPFVAINNRFYQGVPHCEYVHQFQNCLKMFGIYLDVVI